ncbi:MAG: glyoxylate/hydroxypyruvate reductase A [Pseudomonadota bacterium]
MPADRASPAPVVLFAGDPEDRDVYRDTISRAAEAAGQAIHLVMAPEDVEPDAVDYLVLAPSGPVKDFAPFTGLKAILNLWAGVEQALALPLPEGVPLVRMVEEGLTEGMLDYVTGHVMRHHLDVDRWIATVPPVPWARGAPPLARDRRVTVLGLGALGTACARRLVANGFAVTGWARRAREIEGVRCLAGVEGLGPALDGAEILVLLLPQTPATRHVLDAGALGRLAPGAAVINAGRGPLIDDDALLAALDRGQVGHATLDVFDVEPLPEDHPYWRHPRVTVTPHIASVTRPATASVSLIAQIRRGEAGEPFKHVVHRGDGY